MENKASQITCLLNKSKWSVLISIIFLGTLMLGVVGCRNEVASASDIKEKIYFADSSWDSAQVHNRIASFIVKNGYGHPVDYVYGDTLVLFEGLVKGDIDVSMEIFQENIREAYNKGIESGDVKDLGSNFLGASDGLYIPTNLVKGDPEFDKNFLEESHGSAYVPENVVKVVNAGFKKRAPEIVSFLEKYKITLKQTNEILMYMHENGVDTEATAIWFLKEYPEQWKAWVPEDVAVRVGKVLDEIK